MSQGKEQRIGRQVVVSLVLAIIALPLMAGVQFVFARTLGAKSFGDFTYVSTVVFFATIPAILGMDHASPHFVATYRAKEEWGLLRGFLRHSVLQVVSTASFVGLVLVVGCWIWLGASDPLFLAFVMGAIGLPLRLLMPILAGHLAGFRRVLTGHFALTVIQQLLLVLALGFFVAFPTGLGLTVEAIAAGPVAAFVILCWLFWERHVAVRDGAQAARPEYKRREWAVAAFQFSLVGALHTVLTQTDILMLGWFESKEMAGRYAIAGYLSRLVTLGYIATLPIVAPRFSEAIAKGDNEELQRLVTKAARTTLSITAILVAPILVFRLEIASFYGADFELIASALLILLVGQAVNALVGPVGEILSLSNQRPLVARTMAYSAGLNVLLNLLLIPSIGFIGAAIATTTTNTVWNVVLAIYVHRKLGIVTIRIDLAGLLRGNKESSES